MSTKQYAFDKRFCNEGEYEVGLFHQDEVIDTPVEVAERLAPNWSDFGAWLAGVLATIRSGFEKRS